MTESLSKKLLPVIIGITLTAVLLGFLGYLSANRKDGQVQSPPQLRIVAPVAGAVDSPLIVRFHSSEPIRQHHSGWSARAFHLHARVNGVEHMPAAADIVREDTLYTWRIDAVARGPISLYLGWANQHHLELEAGRSATVESELR